MRDAVDPVAGQYQDLVGLVWSTAVSLSDRMWTIVRVMIAGLTPVVCWFPRKRPGHHISSDFGLLMKTLAMLYLLLFNPRTEGETYVMPGPIAAIWTTRELQPRRWARATMLVAFCLVLRFSRRMTGGRNVWLRPAATLAFATFVTSRLRGQDDGTRTKTATRLLKFRDRTVDRQIRPSRIANDHRRAEHTPDRLGVRPTCSGFARTNFTEKVAKSLAVWPMIGYRIPNTLAIGKYGSNDPQADHFFRP